MILDNDEKILDEIYRKLPITPKIVTSLGWKITKDEGWGKKGRCVRTGGIQDGRKPEYWIIELNRDDICAPVRFWYKPVNKLDHCLFSFYFPGAKEIFHMGDWDRDYELKTVDDLLKCWEFVKIANKYKFNLTNYWNKNIKNSIKKREI